MAKTLSEKLLHIIWGHEVDKHCVGVLGELFESNLTRSGDSVDILFLSSEFLILLINGEHEFSELGHEHCFFIYGQRVAEVHQDVLDVGRIFVDLARLSHLFQHG